MSKYIVKPIVCNYGIVNTNTHKTICVCTLKSNAEYIVDILNADASENIAYTYNKWPCRKWEIGEREGE